MKIHIITIFPESFESFFSTSIIAKAKQKQLFEVFLYKLNDFSTKKFKQVDNKAY
jgi:tRNA (guanine37-N1)-methyltransferase